MNKPICERIAYYTRKLAQRVSVHPAHKLPRAYTFRNQRLQQYKKRLNELCELQREHINNC